MKVIITGGSGLLGQELVGSLTADKHEVIILSRSPEKVTDLPSLARAEKWDGKTAQGWGHLADGADAIVNLAGETIAGKNPLAGRWTPERKVAIRDSRVNAGKAVVEAVKAAKNKPKVVLQASAVGYYGATKDEQLTETAPAGQDFLASVCKDWEASTAEVEKMGVRRVIFRTGVVLSNAGGAFPFMVLPFRMFAGGPLGSGKQWFPWIHEEDEMLAIRFLLQHSTASGVFNVCAPNPLTNKDFGKAIGRVLGRPSFMPAPGFAFQIAFGELATLLLDGQRQIPARLKELGFKWKFAEADEALRDLLK